MLRMEIDRDKILADLRLYKLIPIIFMVAGKIGKFRTDIVVELFEVFDQLVVGLDHFREHNDGLPGPFVRRGPGLVFLPGYDDLQVFEADVHENVVCEVVVLAPAVVQLAGKDLLPLHELEMVDDGFRRDHQRLRYFGDKTRFLAQQYYDAPTVPVPEDIQEPGDLCKILHIYLMLVMREFKEWEWGF